MAPRIVRAVLGVAAFLALGCRDAPTGGAFDALDQFDAYWRTFDREYSYFPLKGIDWAAQRASLRPLAAQAATPEALVDVLRAMVVPLRDAHVRFVSPSGETIHAVPLEPPNNWDPEAWDRVARACGLHQQAPNLGSCTMQGVGYIVVGQWSGFGAADVDAVVDRFREASALIIDVRMNGGGNDALAFALAGRFAAAPTVSGYVRYRDGPRHDDLGAEIVRRVSPRGPFRFANPVVVLTGRGTKSSAESFVSAMRELPGVTIMGDTTGGASGNPREHALGQGWRYTVSRWIEWTADRRIIEWAGVPPDVMTPWDAAAALEGRDNIIEAAIGRLGGAAGRVELSDSPRGRHP